MDPLVLTLVLMAAVLHATWNALIGAIMLNEPFGRRRVIAAACVAFGVVLLQFSKYSFS
jgi:drug/metabolite transporter (DMT)-like permease